MLSAPGRSAAERTDFSVLRPLLYAPTAFALNDMAGRSASLPGGQGLIYLFFELIIS
jgi:hypothetical protein